MDDEGFMALALKQANQAAGQGEVPVGAIVVRNGDVIATGCNAPINGHDPTAHAEIVALRAAAHSLGNYRLAECEMFVTLEPCAMCAGAMLHARLKRVVFGAADPKTGAAGSVLNLFALPQLNHQTTVQGGVLADQCSAMLQDFFRLLRADRKAACGQHHPLRDDALRTPASAFENLPAYPWPAQYVSDLPALAGLRMHYLDEAGRMEEGGVKPVTYLCLHGSPAWSYLYRKMMNPLLLSGHRVVVPDLVGFGKSDKPKKDGFHTFAVHRQILVELVERLNLQNIILVVQDWGGMLGLTLPMDAPERYRGLLVISTTLTCGDTLLTADFLAWREMCGKSPQFNVARLLARSNPRASDAERVAYNAPFPNKGYRAALRAFPRLASDGETAVDAEVSRQARQFWRDSWTGQTLMVIGAQDPVLGAPDRQELKNTLSGCGDPLVMEQAGYFIPEHGEQVAAMALSFFGRSA